MASKTLNNSILRAKDGNKRSMRAVLDTVIDKAGGFARYVKMCLEDDDTFKEAIKDRLRLEPKAVNIGGTGGIQLTLAVPRPDNELAPDGVIIEGEIVREQIASSELSTATQAQHTELSTSNDELSTGYPQAEGCAEKKVHNIK